MVALQTFTIHGAAQVNGQWRLQVEREGMITAWIKLDRKGGEAIPMGVVKLPSKRFIPQDASTPNGQYHGVLILDDSEYVAGMTSVTIDADEQWSVVWGYSIGEQFVQVAT